MNRPTVLADRLRDKRRREFFGREAELAEFTAMLDRLAGTPAVLFLHGPGGIGKSTLLRNYAELAADRGRPVFEVLGGDVGGSPEGFLRLAAAALTEPDAVLLVDAFEECQHLAPWLQESFLPELPVTALVVLAGRCAPDPRWTAAPGWNQVLGVRELGELPAPAVEELLAARGVPNTRWAAVTRFAGGHPLALSLAGGIAVREPEHSGLAEQAVASALLPHLLAGDVPSPAHRRALEVCARAYGTTEGLLRAVLPEHDAAPLFEWLRRLPFVSAGRYGLAPHDVVRAVLSADLRWRDPAGFADLHRRLRGQALARVRDASPATVLREAAALRYLYRDSGVPSYQHQWRRDGEVIEAPCQERDHHDVLELAQSTGEAERVQWWLGRQPGAFRVLRCADTGELVGVTAWLRLLRPEPAELADPVVAAAWRHAESTSPPREGEHLGLARFSMLRTGHRGAGPARDLIRWRLLAEMLRGERLAWTYLVAEAGEPWRGWMTESEQPPAGEPLEIGGRLFALYAHDWRDRPAEQWLAAADQRLLEGTASVEAGVLCRAEFDEAVREAVRALHRPEALASSALVRTRLLATHCGRRAEEALREVLTTAIEGLAADPHCGKAHRALVVTFVTGTATREAAAARLGLPFSTYRRHLATGLDRLCDSLWHWANQAA
ncbi:MULTISPECIES: ATP-binding protein [unclassified Crossiella]|uniref:ATP-binding protein n=1 Tax=unclassified Crossiella TaxID=2620835 RepID=UPI001FFF2A01|nr:MULTISPECIES: ATP-binding protein [unclassified Crossiella]MCK2240545.1 ATP-binding protein [Crossiella sp. S99.2]MCK2253004.1 ATP-binding protein [Crossiella sp. S99.1]